MCLLIRPSKNPFLVLHTGMFCLVTDEGDALTTVIVLKFAAVFSSASYPIPDCDNKTPFEKSRCSKILRFPFNNASCTLEGTAPGADLLILSLQISPG